MVRKASDQCYNIDTCTAVHVYQIWPVACHVMNIKMLYELWYHFVLVILIGSFLLFCRIHILPCAIFQCFLHSVSVWSRHMATVLLATILHCQEAH